MSRKSNVSWIKAVDAYMIETGGARGLEKVI